MARRGENAYRDDSSVWTNRHPETQTALEASSNRRARIVPRRDLVDLSLYLDSATRAARNDGRRPSLPLPTCQSASHWDSTRPIQKPTTATGVHRPDATEVSTPLPNPWRSVIGCDLGRLRRSVPARLSRLPQATGFGFGRTLRKTRSFGGSVGATASPTCARRPPRRPPPSSVMVTNSMTRSAGLGFSTATGDDASAANRTPCTASDETRKLPEPSQHGHPTLTLIIIFNKYPPRFGAP